MKWYMWIIIAIIILILMYNYDNIKRFILKEKLIRAHKGLSEIQKEMTRRTPSYKGYRTEINWNKKDK